ncbi:LuxR C-terminal-related transcriptional regulator [Microbacterium sp. SLBN-146]|uniref:helix-turn-helix transcriptional regulator n=1 Tax=Microbacterium sp. SLBN-146 TaxID=2768457 RepID=UPI001151264B|nr:LuxR C-terminal-related transcriptional regulator [Microbacterium sp. SLBN-146]TQJ31155.1 AAA ATPase-like protein [Microbacterium sp. SLBN-146]
MSLVQLRDGPGTGTAARAAGEGVVGRAEPLAALTSALRSGARTGAVAALTGDPGIGRTTMLAALARVASSGGMRVVRVAGFDDESELRYAVLSTLVAQLDDVLPEIPAHQRHAIEVACARRRGTGEQTMAVCAGTLSLVRRASATRPLAVLVDDLHWSDAESARVLRFVAHRLVGSRVAMLIAARREPGSPTTRLPVDPLPLGGLDEYGCRRLAALLGHELTSDDATALKAITGGNPLAVRWCLRAGSDGTIDPLARIAEGLPESLDRAWGRLWSRWEESTRIAVTVVATAHDPTEESVTTALRRLGVPMAALTPAEAAGLVVRRQNAILVEHPLLRSLARARMPAVVREAAPPTPVMAPRIAVHVAAAPLPVPLTRQERRVMNAMAQGMTNIEIGRTLFLSPKTVEAHLTRVYRKLGIRSRTELVRFALTSALDPAS